MGTPTFEEFCRRNEAVITIPLSEYRELLVSGYRLRAVTNIIDCMPAYIALDAIKAAVYRRGQETPGKEDANA